MVTMEEQQLPEQQWQPEEENGGSEEEDGAAGAALKTSRSRKSYAAAVSDAASNGDAPLATSEPENGVHEQKRRDGELRNDGGEKNGTEMEPEIKSEKNVYYDKDEGVEAVHEPVTENSGLKVSASVGIPGDDGLEIEINNNDVQKNQNGAANNQNNYVLKDEIFSHVKNPPLEKSKNEHDSENNGFGVSGSFGKSGNNGVVIVNNSDGQRNQNGVVSNQCKEILKVESFSGLKSLAPEKLNGENEADVSSNDITAACDDIDLIEEIDSESADIDLDAVLKTQNTHDLYCPNCNSCITRRVILRKRKRHIRISSDDVKRNKGEIVISSEGDINSAHATSDERRNTVDVSLDDPMPPSGDGINRDREPDVFRCLSCLSLFIPTGDGLKIFKIFGGKRKSEHEGTQGSETVSAEKKNWLSSMFASRKDSKQNDQVNDHVAYLEASIVQGSREVKSPAQSFGSEVPVNDSTGESQNGGDNVAPTSMLGPKWPLDSVVEQTSDRAEPNRPEFHTVQQFGSSSITLTSNEHDHPTTLVSLRSPILAKEPTEAATSMSQQDGLKILVSPSIEQKLNVAIERKYADGKSSVLSMPKPATVAEESDVKEEVNAVADVPSGNGHDVGPLLPKSPVVDEKMEVTINDVAHSSDAFLYPTTGTKVDIHVERPFKANNGACGEDNLFFQRQQLDSKKDLKDLPAKSNADVAHSSEAFHYTTTGTKVDIHVERPFKSNNVAFGEDNLFSQHRQLDSKKDLKDMPAKSNAGGDTVVVIERLVEQGASQEAQSTLSSAGHLLGSERTTEDRRFHGLEIVKSIVYGGLAESITSLGVVSSAAGAGSTTLNILALGLANLIGGLFIIAHNLWDLKSDISEEIARLDRYQELLGRRQNFLIHAVVSILSYLVFGLVPPVTYAFSFRQSNDTDFKLIAVAIASLLCIIFLAIGKAHTQRPPQAYVKTVSYYVLLGFMATGVSYVAGDLIKKLMDRLGWFHTSSGLDLSIPALETTPVHSGWGSY